jgi:PST family polysaccharide transporter
VPFQILIASLLFRTSYKISDSLALATGSMKSRALRQWIYAAAVAGGALLGTPWGLSGVSAGVALAVILNFLMMLQLALRLTNVPFALILRLHGRQAIAALPVVAASAVAVELARRASMPDAAVLALGGFAAAATWSLMWWQFRQAFGETGEWAFRLAADRLAPLSRKLRAYVPNGAGESPTAPLQQAAPSRGSRAEV